MKVVLDRIDVDLWIVEIGRCGRDELRTCRTEEFFVNRQRLLATALKFQQLITVLLTECSVNSIIKSRGVESYADGNECSGDREKGVDFNGSQV